MTEIELIKQIREKTSLSFKDIKNAITTVGGDEEKVIKYLREQGALKNQSRSDRATTQGGLFTYNHENRLVVVVEIRSETDFVSRSDIFKSLGNDLALHAAAYSPKCYAKTSVDEEFISKELDIFRTQLLAEGKNEDMIQKILLGKRNKLIEEVAMESQPFLKDSTISVGDYVTTISQETGEKIVVTNLSIFSLT
ncbi:MAG: elongation factor Ts [candidate division SR1 bacterium]|nr:elongation factor Ts [candidate division SR1 bacterium]